MSKRRILCSCGRYVSVGHYVGQFILFLIFPPLGIIHCFSKEINRAVGKYNGRS